MPAPAPRAALSDRVALSALQRWHQKADVPFVAYLTLKFSLDFISAKVQPEVDRNASEKRSGFPLTLHRWDPF
jgi:hypothetical protein